VISFYRGGWCPYCNLELKALQAKLPEFKNLGVQLLAISPEKPDIAVETINKDQLTFPVLSDV
jgi:peroxiredoxin